MDKPVSRQIMEQAFQLLNDHLDRFVTLIMGGGGSMIMAHGYPLATTDVDAVPQQATFEDIDALVKAIARELGLPGDWLNPYFSTFTYVLPSDYSDRLIDVFKGERLRVRALGREDMLIMKCFAHRPKDLGHARALIRLGVDRELVTRVIEDHVARGTPQAEAALEFFEDLVSEAEGT